MIVGVFITKTFFPSYPVDVEDEIKSLKFENDSLRMVISQSGNNPNANNGNNEELEAERRAKADAEAKAARERKAKEEAEAEAEKERKGKEAAEKKVHEERVAKEEAERKAAEAKVQAEEEARRMQEEQRQNQITKVISPEYKEQIRKTQQDFAKLKELLQPIISSGTIYQNEIKQMKDMLRNMNNNLSSIESNDSYQYLDQPTKNIIKNLREETKKIEADFKKVLGTQQTSNPRSQGLNSSEII